MGRAPCCEKVGLRKGRWTEEEDEKLANYIKANGEGSWRSLPKNAGLLRCGKSCRLRWINYLRADLKRGNISAEEEKTIVKLHASLGNRWSVIAAQLPGRTDNEIKNYWNSHLGRRIHSFRRANGDGAMTVIMDLGKMVGIPCKRRGGRTSRSAMQKNTAVVPIAKGRHDQGGAMLPSNRDQTDTGGSPRGDDMKSSCPPCGEPLDGPVVDTHGSRMPAHDEPLDGEMFDCDQLLPSELWETTRAMASELFGPSDQGMEGGFWGGCGFPEEGESGDWGAVSLLSEERGSGATMSASSTSDDRENVPTPAWGEERDRQGGAGEGAPGASAAGHPRGEAEECNSAVTVDRWVDAELEEMATKLWDEVGEAWPWQWEVPGDGELDLRQPYMDGGVYEEVALDSLFL